MTAARHRRARPAQPPAVSEEGRQAVVIGEFRYDLAWWIASHPRTALRIMRLVEEIIRDPFVGTGKPEALKHDQHGRWSRRITESDRLLYLVKGAEVFFLAARWHYGRN
jgi:toxin YoeB